MKISTKGRYGLRIMLVIALNGTDGSCVSIRDIAEREQLSDKYLEQIITSLSKAGLVSSIRGAKGGYRLTRQPDEITVEDILIATEGTLAPMECAENSHSCDKYCDCVMTFVWQEMYDAVAKAARRITLQNIVDRSSNMQGKSC